MCCGAVLVIHEIDSDSFSIVVYIKKRAANPDFDAKRVGRLLISYLQAPRKGLYVSLLSVMQSIPFSLHHPKEPGWASLPLPVYIAD
jgi:hypothetical protein